MAGVKEKEVYAALSKYAGTGETVKVGKAEVQVSLQPQDIHVGDSPDFILWLGVRLKVFAQNLNLRVPIPIEAEGVGKNALVDLKKFVKRGHYSLEIPMVVVTAGGYSSSREGGTLPVQFRIRQIPVRLLKESA